MTFAELLDLRRSRGRAHRVWIEGVHEIGRTDDILLLLRSDDAREEWRLAYDERGRADRMADGLDEQAAIAAVLGVLGGLARPARRRRDGHLDMDPLTARDLLQRGALVPLRVEDASPATA